MSEQDTETLILQGDGSGSPLHFSCRLDTAAFVLVQAPLEFLYELPVAGSRSPLVVAVLNRGRWSLILYVMLW
jgi:hypothetical protein